MEMEMSRWSWAVNVRLYFLDMINLPLKDPLEVPIGQFMANVGF